MSDESVTLRIPVARFRETYDAALKLGDVLQRSMTAQDVTESYQALDLRIATLKASRARLIDLLANAKTEQEKVQLLQEIQRLTEQLDQMEIQLKTLASLAAYSRLTIEAFARQAEPTHRAPTELAAFQWIRLLSPFRRDAALQGDWHQLPTPEGMVAFDDDREHWIAESADGAVVWAHERDNEPRGSSEFWLAALEERLAPEYASAQRLQIGGYQVLALVDQSERAYRYAVGVRVVDDELRVVEIYYPSQEHEARYDAAVRRALEADKE